VTSLSFITPDWPAPSHIKSLSTTRIGGVSQPPFDSLNLGTHVGDDLEAVMQNREKLTRVGTLPEQPRWLNQVHGTRIINTQDWHLNMDADASYSVSPQHVCSIMTADCLPVLVSDRHGTFVAAIHAGWRGLASGIIEKTLKKYTGNPADLLIWLGPAIGPQQFEVGFDVFSVFTQQDEKAHLAFEQVDDAHFLANIYLLARQRLSKFGIEQIWGGDLCTVSDSDLFFSYRRDGQSGRMASMIWIEPK
jgi:hypothetical protein